MAISDPIKQWKVELLVCVIFHCLFSSIRLSREEQIHHWRNWLTSFSWFAKTQQTTTSLLYNYDHILSTPNVNITESFDHLEDPVSVTTSLVRQGFYGPTVVALTGSNEISCKEDKAKFNTHAPALSLKIIFAKNGVMGSCLTKDTLFKTKIDKIKTLFETKIPKNIPWLAVHPH